MQTIYAFAKAIHLIGMVSWMAGLFYLVRIMVYHAMSSDKPEQERNILHNQFVTMEWKVYRIILQPAVVITWTCGSLMLYIQPAWLEQTWMIVKFCFLLALTVYTFYLKGLIKALESGVSRFKHIHFRILNEVPTVIMAGIIFPAVFRTAIHLGWLFAGLLLFSALIGWGLYRANRS